MLERRLPVGLDQTHTIGGASQLADGELTGEHNQDATAQLAGGKDRIDGLLEPRVAEAARASDNAGDDQRGAIALHQRVQRGYGSHMNCCCMATLF